jgi:hypothetical protein
MADEDIDDNEDEGQFTLMAQLIQANFMQSQANSSALIDSLTERAEVAEATLEAIRTLIPQYYSGDYLPNPERVLSALYPAKRIIDHFRQRDGS